MPVNPRGTSWQAAVSYKGKRARADFPTKEEAERWHADALAALINSRPIPGSKRTVADATTGTSMSQALAWTEQGRWEGTKAARESSLKANAVVRYFGPDRAIETITTGEIADFQRHLTKAGDGPATVNRKVSALGAMMRETAERRSFAWAPPAFPPRKQEPRGRNGIVTADEVERIEALLRKSGDHETADLIALLFWTGLRLGEMETLRWEQTVQPEVGRGFLRLTQTKTGEDRDVPIVAQAKVILDKRRAEWMELKASPSHPYFNRKGARVFAALRYAHALGAFKRAIRLLEIPGDDLVLHSLRHSCATHLLRKGLPERQVMKWLGHSSMAMMVRYTKVLPMDLEAMADKLDGNATVITRPQGHRTVGGTAEPHTARSEAMRGGAT